MNGKPAFPLKHIQIGLQLAVSVMLGFYAGYMADKKLGTSPWLMLAGTAAGMGVGFYSLMRETSGDK